MLFTFVTDPNTLIYDNSERFGRRNMQWIWLEMQVLCLNLTLVGLLIYRNIVWPFFKFPNQKEIQFADPNP